MLYLRTSCPEGGTCGPRATGPPVQPRCGNALPASLWKSSGPRVPLPLREIVFMRSIWPSNVPGYKAGTAGPQPRQSTPPARRSGLVLHAAELHSQVPERAAEASLVVDRQQWLLTGVAASTHVPLWQPC